VRGRAGGGLATGRRRFSALVGVLREGTEETEGPLSAAAALPWWWRFPWRRRLIPATAAAYPSSDGAAWRRHAVAGCVYTPGPLAWAVLGLIFGLNLGQKRLAYSF
jgi:hypothetical protein